MRCRHEYRLFFPELRRLRVELFGATSFPANGTGVYVRSQGKSNKNIIGGSGQRRLETNTICNTICMEDIGSQLDEDVVAEDAERAAPRESRSSSNVDDLLTPEEVAEKLKVSGEQVRSLIRKGDLGAINIGTGPKRPLYRIPQQDLEEFLVRRRHSKPDTISRRSRRHPVVRDHFPNHR